MTRTNLELMSSFDRDMLRTLGRFRRIERAARDVISKTTAHPKLGEAIAKLSLAVRAK